MVISARLALCLALLSSCPFLQGQDSQSPNPQPGTVKENTPVFVDLLRSDLAATWKHYAADEAVPLNQVWKIVRETAESEPVLVCTGQPKGFLFTTESFDDFEMTLQWRYPTDANGNSGILVYTQNERRIWPSSIQVQFHQPKAGSIFPSGDARSANTSDAKPALAKPVGMWNECRIVSRSGQLSVEINGEKAGEISGSEPASGHIALQSEGSEVHFRRILIRRIKKDDKQEAPPASPDGNKASTGKTE
ncbi:MAG: DUF1080 domain-containing protein [Planctomycetaceae bacterium]|nr:DUF1080 domain-containing protein [Planctomycetaceae bacterium]